MLHVNFKKCQFLRFNMWHTRNKVTETFLSPPPTTTCLNKGPYTMALDSTPQHTVTRLFLCVKSTCDMEPSDVREQSSDT